jgi:hypothetical protein
LLIGDLTGINVSPLPGFDLGFRCKSLTVCGVNQNCLYYGAQFGSVQSSDTSTAAYTDGSAMSPGVPVKIRIDVGAASQCGNPALQIAAGESVILAFDGKELRVYFPAVADVAVTLYVREDGATFHDVGLTNLAQSAP